jgi:hypothetical protein
VDLFGQGDGDLSVRLRWTTPADGPLPVPEAHLGVLADNDGVVDSYGVELSVTNLASSPDHATAVVTVAASGGEELSFEPTLTSLAPAGCDAVEGQVYWTGPDAKGKEAAALGDPPFTYTVELTLDGTAYVATATWPMTSSPTSSRTCRWPSTRRCPHRASRGRGASAMPRGNIRYS